MARNRSLLAATLLLSASAFVGICVLGMLDKDGRIVARLHGEVFVLGSPLFGIAACATWWRRHRWLPIVGLAVAALAACVILWGTATDYLAWSRDAPGREAMYFAGFLAMLCCWALCLGFVALGALAWLLSRRHRARTERIAGPAAPGGPEGR